MNVTHLRCEYLREPSGINVLRPRLSWVLETDRRGQRQTAFHLIVASSADRLAQDEGDLWDSGKAASDQSIHVEYGGRPLRSRQPCHWKVRVWDGDDQPSAWSTPAGWEMGLLKPGDWKAQWVSEATPPPPLYYDTPPSPILRREFEASQPIVSARAYISGLGYYELHINGKRIGDQVLDPAFTRYDRTVLYVTHDITDALTTGVNAVGVMLGNGWYNGHTDDEWDFHKAPWRDRPKLLLQIEVLYEDGTRKQIGTDVRWRVSTGPVVFDGLRNGEIYDARAEKPGWALPGYDDREWDNALAVPSPGGVLTAQMCEPIKVTQTIRPVTVRELRPGVAIADMGQAFSGWTQLTVSGAAGTEVRMEHSESVTPEGDLDASDVSRFIRSGPVQTDVYILKGEGVETWEPRFTYHGFRYVRVTGYPGKLTLDALRGRVVHTALEDRGQFACSDSLISRIHELVRWSTVCNYHGMPTDCPHREKNGWTGDAMLSAEQTLYNFGPMAAYTKWMNDLADAQRPSGQLPGIVPTGGWGYNWGSGPAWDSAYVLMPWDLYLYCGDTRILATHYAGMKRYVDYMTSMATAHIVSFGLGDWCPPREEDATPETLTSTGYYYADTCVVARSAELLGKTADAKKYARLAAKIKHAFRKLFYRPETATMTVKGQTALACALYQGFIDPEEEPRVLASLAGEIERCNRHIDCGILGTKYVMHMLDKHGRNDLAYAIATQTDFPSWGHWIQQGATTLWEMWNGGGSHLHHMFSDIGAWFYKALGGIHGDLDQPGFKHVIFRPSLVGDLTWVRAEHRSMYGLIRSSWKIAESRFVYDIAVPANTTATVYLPTDDVDNVTEGGVPVTDASEVELAGLQEGKVVLQVGSGEYRFETALAGSR